MSKEITKKDVLFEIGETVPNVETDFGFTEESIYKAMDKWAEERAIGFYKNELSELFKHIEYLGKVKEDVSISEFKRAITTFPSTNASARYKQYLQSLTENKQP